MEVSIGLEKDCEAEAQRGVGLRSSFDKGGFTAMQDRLRVRRGPVVLFIALVGLMATRGVAAQELDWSPYARVLAQHLSHGLKNGTRLALVDYPALKASGAVERLAEQLAAFPLGELETREERLAFYINAYNILALKMVLDHWPVESIKDAGNLLFPVWKKPAGQLRGKPVTLDELEHRILRPMGEPRVHLAIVCASVSCPDLRTEPYTASCLEHQLDDQVRVFLANEAKGLRQDQDRLRVSKIFSWFEDDFDRAGGIAGFIRRYREDLSPEVTLRADLPYDWAVNAMPTVH